MTNLKSLTVSFVALALASTAWPIASGRSSRPDKQPVAFEYKAIGASARSHVERWIVPDATAIGTIVSAAVCDDDVYLLDRAAGAVHRVSRTGRITSAIRPPSGTLRLATGLAADCQRRLLFVVEQSGVVVLEIDSSREVSRFPKPGTFVHSNGSAVLDVEAQVLYVPGLWPAADSDWLIKPVDRMFAGDRIGYRLDLQTAQTTPMVSAVDRGCWSLGPNCLYTTLDVVPGSSHVKWVAAHRVSYLVGMYDAEFRLLRTIDVRSPLFLDTGRRSDSRRVPDMIAWNEDNSVIRRVYGFDDRIVTVHSFNRTKSWKRGQPLDFDVFMNVHTLDGAGIASDIRLPDLPVGRDATSLYVIDYGPAGRRAIGRDPISLVRIPVTR